MSEAATSPDIPDANWENPFAEGTWLHNIFGDVLREDRDIVMIIDDYFGRRGTGKTIASLGMGSNLDQTPEGITDSKASLSPEEIRNAYTQEKPGSALVLDEGEQAASNREAMTKTNKALREIMSMGRVEQKYVVINTPIKGFIDKDLQKLADVWISMTRRGRGLVHHLRWEPYSEQLLTPQKQWLEFEDVPRGTDLRGVYNNLTEEKRERMDGEEGTFLTESEHKEILRKRVDQAERDKRDEIIRDLLRHPEVQNTELTQGNVADAVGLTQPAVSTILNETDDQSAV